MRRKECLRPVIIASARAKGISHQLDLGRLGQQDADNVESDAIPLNVCSAGILARRTLQMPLLFRTDSAVRSAEFVRGPRFHLHKNEIVALPGHQINFPGSISRPEVASHNGVPLAAQETVGQILATAAASHVDGRAPHTRAVAEAVREAVEEGEHVREASRSTADGISQKLAFLSDHRHEL